MGGSNQPPIILENIYILVYINSMTYKNYRTFTEITSKILDRVEVICSKVNSEIDNHDYRRYLKDYDRAKAMVVISNDGLTIWNNDCYKDCICLCISPHVYEDLPIEALWDDKVVDNYIEKYSKHEKTRQEISDKIEYEEYLKLKEKFENK